MTAKDFIVAIEIGSSKITGIAGKKESDGTIQVFAYAREDAAPCIRKGVVSNIDKMAASLTAILNKLNEELADSSIAKVYVGIGGQSLRTKKNVITRQLNEETKIPKELVQSLMENNRRMSYPNLEILDVVPQEYKVKNSSVVDPAGMVSNQIEGHYLNIVGRSSIKQKLLSSFRQAHLKVAGFLVAPVCMAKAVLTDAERRSGCVLVDLGADTTTVVIFKNDILRHLVVLPLGSNSLTKDIAKSLSIEESEADTLKIKYGCAYTDPNDAEVENRSYNLFDGQMTVSAQKLNNIVEARMEEIIVNILYQIDLSGYRDKLPAGVILTGGGANLKKLTEAFTLRHKIGKVRIAGFVQGDVKSTRSELLIKNGMLNTLFGLLAAGRENCCELPKDLFGGKNDSHTTSDQAKDYLRKQQEEAKLVAEEDELWSACQNNEEWGKYLERYPNGRYADEADKAIRAAERERLNRRDDAYWEKCKNGKNWRDYLKKYPKGRHAEEAEEERQKEPTLFNKISKKFKDLGSELMNDDEN